MNIWKPYPITAQIRINALYSFFDCHKTSDFFFEGESHDFWECVYIKKGKICVSADERVYHLTHRQIIFHKPLELHKYYVEDETGADLIIFSFSASGKLVDFYKNKVFTVSQNQSKIIDDMMDFVYGISKENTEQPLPETFGASPTYLQTIASFIERLFLSIYEDSTISPVSKSHDAVLFRNAVSFMHDNITFQPLISDMAKHCNISESGLKRLFNKYSGLGVHKYFLKMKITAAANELRNGASVTDTSEKFGFASQGYFSAAFKRETGQSPTEYKLQNYTRIH